MERGKMTCMVGENVSGKTTIISILQKIYPLQLGKIKIVDYNMANVSNCSLRERISAVSQQVDYFSGMIVDNIAICDFRPDMKRIANIIKDLGLESFFDGLLEGYVTLVGEHGVSLSGGERQRKTIARAICRNPDIYFFNEATSSLDTVSEKYVKNVTQKLSSEGKTVVVVAHQLSIVKDADKIVVINDGTVKEMGSHDELLNSGGYYSMLWNEQTERNLC